MATRAKKEAFFREHYAYAREAGLNDVQARLAVSQAALETGWGEIGQAVKGNNFHGMKIGDDWTGKSISLPTREETKKGKSYTVNAKFRQYETPVDSYRDWAKKMETNWPGVMKAKTFDQAVKALDKGVKGVYATEDSYGTRVKGIESDLVKSGIPGEFEQPEIGGLGSLLSGFRDLVKPSAVETTTVDPGPSPLGGGLLALGDVRSIANAGVLDGLHPAFQDRAKAFFSEAARRGINIAPVAQSGGYRTPEQQSAIQSTGVIAASPGGSYHNYGLSFDYAPVDANNRPIWDKQDPRWSQAKALAEEMGLHQPIAGDLGHVQSANFPARVPDSIRNAPRFNVGSLSYPELSPVTTLDVTGGTWPGFQPAESLAAAPLGEVERSPLGEVARGLDATATGASLPGLGGFASGEFSPSLPPDRQMPSGPVGGSLRSPTADRLGFHGVPGGLLGSAVAADFQPASVARAAEIASYDTPGSIRVGGVLPERTTERLSPISNYQSMFHNPVHEALQPTAATERLSPLGATERVVGQEVGGLGVDPSGLYSQGLLGPAATLAQQGAALAAQMPGFNMPEQAPTIASPEAVPGPENSTTIGQFPDAPAAPTRSQRMKAALPGALKQAAIGMAVGGLPGAIVGLAGGLLGPEMGGLMGRNNFDPSEAYGVGSGLGGMMSAMGGPRGATATSRSHPGYSRTSLGGLGSLLSGPYGTQVQGIDGGPRSDIVGPDGRTRGILSGIMGALGLDRDRPGGLGGFATDRGGINGSGYSGNGLY